MDIKEVIRGRRSIRKYVPGVEISDGEIKEMLEAAMMAPSACNSRPWEFIVIKSAEAKQKVLNAHPHAQHLKDAAAAILVCAREELQKGICEGYFPQDCGAAIENILLSAYSLGYGTCWCGIYPREQRLEAFTKEFNLDTTPIGLIVIGKADEEPAAKGFYEDAKVKFI